MTKKKSAKGEETKNNKGQPKSDKMKMANHRVLAQSQGIQRKDDDMIRVVGIGASAGGLEAFEQFFTALPGDTGLAYVLIQHLDPTHKSILTELLTKYTAMNVMEVTDGTKAEPNRVHVIPPNKDMAILNGTLYLMEPTISRGLRQPIDFFFRSLAEDLKERAIGIVLSGSGSEGTLGLRAIKGEGGMVMVQDPASAKYDGMPRSAIATGLVDYVLAPQRMPDRLIAYVTHAPSAKLEAGGEATGEEPNIVQKILLLVRSRTHHDFTQYKKNTIVRRIERRMAVHQLVRKQDYLRFLQEDPLEIKTLFKELLIGVTNFFRDATAFEMLKKRSFPAIFDGDNSQIRVWVPACTTGEEAYSIAILLQEYASQTNSDKTIQIFATDIDEEAIEKARTGIYPLSIAADVTADRLDKFFVKDENQFQVKKSLREMVVFAVQNVISDPPFSKLDLISCRNLLIYMNAELQKKLIHLFHYALKSHGYLFLGSSESVGSQADLYSIVDRKWKLYQRRETGVGPHPELHFHSVGEVTAAATPDLKVTRLGLRELAEKALLENYSAAGVIIDEKHDVVYFYGSTAKYLAPSPGEASLNLLKMVREDLRFELANAIRRAQVEHKAVQHSGLRTKINGSYQVINLIVRPIAGPSNRRLLLVVFEDVSFLQERKDDQAPSTPRGETNAQSRIRELEQDLASAKEYLQTTIEELETTNEELKSTNEELQSSNEELQSTNEELETSKEEQQSVNEELVTVNSELQQKIEQLSKVNDDMNNLLASTQVGTIFLDTNMNVQRFTPAVTEIINLIPTDVGRPLAHIVSNLEYDHTVKDAKEVLDTLVPKTVEVHTKDNRWFLMRIQPYRTTENVIEGVVLTFVEITQQKERLAEGILCEHILNTTHEAFLLLDGTLSVIMANNAFYATFAVNAEDTIGRRLYDLGSRQWDIPRLRSLLEKIIPEKKQVEGFEVEHDFETVGKRKMMLNARQVDIQEDTRKLILLAIQDVTQYA